MNSNTPYTVKIVRSLHCALAVASGIPLPLHGVRGRPENDHDQTSPFTLRMPPVVLSLPEMVGLILGSGPRTTMTVGNVGARVSATPTAEARQHPIHPEDPVRHAISRATTQPAHTAIVRQHPIHPENAARPAADTATTRPAARSSVKRNGPMP